MSDRMPWHSKAVASRLGMPHEEYLARLALGEKWCTRCGAWHSRAIFPRDRSRYDGLRSTCGRTIPRPLRTAEQKRATARAGYRAYYAGSGGAAIRERIYARKRGAEPISSRDRELVMEHFGGRCAYCGAPASTIDHAVPVKLGGGSRRGNLLPACVSCNSRKKVRDLDSFLFSCPRADVDGIVDELVMAHVI